MILKDILKLVVRRQKEELGLADSGIRREKLADIDIHSSHAIVLSGIRRCGKSTLMKQVSKGVKKFYYFNFDDPRVVDFELSDFERLDEAFSEEFGGSNFYFFDEIQDVEKWELFVKHLLDRKKKVMITGSNASLLSRELGTRLTGRHLRYELVPFSYQEFLDFSGKRQSVDSLKEYLEKGGFPEYLAENKPGILHELLSDILARDIAVRYGIRNTKTLNELAVYLLTNVGKEFTYNKLKDTFNVGSTNTVLDFMSYFEDSYLMFTINRFDYSLRKQQVNPRKVYSVDNGLSNVNSATFSGDTGRMLENAVFQHLRRKHSRIFYFREKNECDFVIKDKGEVTSVMQVCYKVTDENRLREFDGLLEAMDFFKLNEGMIITLDQDDTISQDGKRIHLVPAWKWMAT